MNTTLENWIKYIFEHPVNKIPWYWDIDEDGWEDIPPKVTVAYLTKIFAESENVLQSYSDAQLNQGFWYLISNNYSKADSRNY
ncbi:MAG TPA: hypothetical protein DEG17_10405 [Cyanobacteria bacterium UBA11149]|nr:hypothetical protein [Cyanobacteria bacterium UBA11367]HBE56412.1 hypothetical protein [Cyanobacteria bacterium UBA11366]HBR72959.1 hypothetical protein [Cyanobacteria bacterium UBA11159]HBS70892.1 hypothetical protein [Cyanobacteria bacterium UBA11153]HBW89260.1 hypothetical protein [Cyanobacteria bacterium UBA11149]HCA97456.1 hypothetical protein [Cyanobacteria bacterium UBA9226]